MICPKCHHRLRETHTYRAGSIGQTQRFVCSNTRCKVVYTAATLLVAEDPQWGQGAYSLSKRMAQGHKPIQPGETPAALRTSFQASSEPKNPILP